MVAVSPIVADAGLVLPFSRPAGPGPGVAGIRRLVLADLDEQAADLRQRVADHARFAGSGSPLTAWAR